MKQELPPKTPFKLPPAYFTFNIRSGGVSQSSRHRGQLFALVLILSGSPPCLPWFLGNSIYFLESSIRGVLSYLPYCAVKQILIASRFAPCLPSYLFDLFAVRYGAGRGWRVGIMALIFIAEAKQNSKFIQKYIHVTIFNDDIFFTQSL